MPCQHQQYGFCYSCRTAMHLQGKKRKAMTSTGYPTKRGAQPVYATPVYKRPRTAVVAYPAALTSFRTEIKALDNQAAGGAPTSFTISTTPQFYCLNQPQQGAAFYQRVGQKIEMKSVHLIGNIVPTGNGTGGNEYLRVMVLYDHQPNGALPAIADILSSYNGAGNISSTSYDGLNLNNRDRFVILRDIRIHIPQNNSTAALGDGVASVIDYGGKYNINEFIKLKNLVAHFKSSTSGLNQIGDLATGALLLVTFGDTASGTAGYAFNWQARLRYKD